MKTAVVLFNLGGPNSKDAIKPFLFNFFTDPNIIRLPYPLRWCIAKMISIRRSKREAGTSYGELGGKSPLLENTQQQAAALEQLLGPDHKVFVCMRYWHPMAPEVVEQVKAYNPDKIVLLPLYPQYSTTTTRSSWQTWRRSCEKAGFCKPEKLVCCYPAENGFIRANAANVEEVYKRAMLETGQAPRILFSAHGLPEDIVRDGDPYQAQCEQTAAEIMKIAALEGADWAICYQSRVGPKKWLGPSTEEALHKAIEDGVPVVILPHAFTQEHVETLVEIEIEYRALAEEQGITGFYRVPTVGIHPDFIRGLADMVIASNTAPDIASNIGVSLCPSGSKECAMRALCANRRCC